MPKKRVGVSLRKPSPAPEVAATSTDAPIASTSEAASVSTAASVETVLREGLVESAPVTQAAPLQVQVIEAFVNGANLVIQSGSIKNTLSSSSFAGINMSNNAQVPDVFHVSFLSCHIIYSSF